MNFKRFQKSFKKNRLLSLIAIMVVLAFVASFIMPTEVRESRFLDTNEVKFKTWEDIMAEKNAIQVTKNTLHACDLLYEMNTTSWTYGGWRCVKNTFYFDKICGENQDQFCDCICYD